MIFKKRWFWIATGSVVAVVTLVSLGYIFLWSSIVESWVSSQIMQTSAAYLEPELRFDRLKYRGPRTIVLKNVTLSSPDPAHPGQSVAIVAAKRVRLELTEIPRTGKPIKFSRVVLQSPEIHLIAAKPGGADLVGFSTFIKASAASSAPGAAAETAPMKPSDFLLLRNVEIANGAIRYDPRTPDTAPLWLDDISADLDFAPTSAASNPGLYSFASTVSRKPAFELALEGQVDIDTFTFTLAKSEATLDLREKNAHFLPPELQKILKSYDVTGQLRVTATGTLPVYHWQRSTLQSTGELTDAQVAVGKNRLAIGSWKWEVDVARGVATIRRADAVLLGGELQIRGTIPLAETRPANLSLNAGNLKLQQLIRGSSKDGVPLYAGNLALHVDYAAPLARWNEQASGSGTLSIREGRIDTIPLFGRIVASVNNSLETTVGQSKHALTDTADCGFSFVGDSVRLDRCVFASGSLGLRATGTIGLDGRLDLRVNGGPMERIQNTMGAVGDAWGRLTDGMAGYRVNGPLDKPQVAMEVGPRTH